MAYSDAMYIESDLSNKQFCVVSQELRSCTTFIKKTPHPQTHMHSIELSIAFLSHLSQTKVGGD